MQRAWRIGCALLLLGLVACTNGAPRSTAKPPGPPSISSAKPSPAATPGPLPAVDRCQTQNLTVQLSGSRAAAGTILTDLMLTNVGIAPCTLFGYVGLLMLDANGQQLPTQVVRSGGILVYRPQPKLFTLQPTTTAFEQIAWYDAPGGPTPCPSASQLEVTPPDETLYLLVTVQIAPCRQGEIDVAPLVGS